MLVPGRRGILVASILSALILSVASGNLAAKTASIYSTSPENIYITGSHDFYALLSQQGYRVLLGSPDYIATRQYLYGRTLYVVIGPDKPFSRSEARILAGLVRDGSIALLVADETGNAAPLLEETTGARMSQDFLESHVAGERSYIVPVICLGRVALSTKVKWLEDVPGTAETICWAVPRPGERYPIGIITRYGKGFVLVLTDSSLFSNFEIEGVKPFIKTRSIALSLISLISRHYPVHYIVFDNTHYKMSRTIEVSATVRRIISGAIDLLSGLAGAAKTRILAAITVAVVVPLILSLALIGLPEKRRVEHREVISIDEVADLVLEGVEKNRTR